MQKIIKKYLDRLHESLNRSALLSAFPPKRATSRLDLHRLSCLDKDLPTEFLELLIYNKNASITLQFKYDELTELSQEIERLEENQEPVPDELIQKRENLKQIATLHAIFAKKLTRESDFIFRETGLRSLWLGYPLAYLTVPSSARKPKKILAPIFLWPIKIKTNLAKQGEVVVSRDVDSGTPIYNKAFDLWCTKYLGVNPDDPHKDDLVEISKSDMQDLINEIFKGFSNPPRLIDEYGIKPIPTRDTLSREAGNQKILNSAILGVIKWENQAVMSNLEEMLGFKDYPIITTGILGGDFNDEYDKDKQIIDEGESTRYHVCKTDHWQQSAIVKSRYKPGIIIHGPPGTGKSETITNIVADCLARGERVLVVCQKRAAIDVVYERIKKAELESLCTIVHDSNSDRKRVIESLKAHVEEVSALSKSSVDISAKRQIFSIEITEIEKVLDDYSKALYAQEDSLKISYRDARLSYLKARERWKGLRENKILCDKLSDINDVILRKIKYKVRQTGKLFYEADPKNNPWKWRKRDFALSRHLKDDVFELINRAIKANKSSDFSAPFKNPHSEIPKNKVEFQESLRNIIELLNSAVSKSNIELLEKWLNIKDTKEIDQEVQTLNRKIKEINLEDINIDLHQHFYSTSVDEFELLKDLASKYLNKPVGIKKIFSFGAKKAEKKLRDKFDLLNLDLDSFDNDVLNDYFTVMLKWLSFRKYFKKSKLISFSLVLDITSSTIRKDYETVSHIVQSYSDWKIIKPLLYEPIAKNLLYHVSCGDFIDYKTKLDEYVTLSNNTEVIFKKLVTVEKLKEWFKDEIIDSYRQSIWECDYDATELNQFLEYFDKLQPLILFDTEFSKLESLEKNVINYVLEELTTKEIIDSFNIKGSEDLSEICVSFVEICTFYNCITRYEDKYPILTSFSGRMYEEKLNRLKELLSEKHSLESKAICNNWYQKQSDQIDSPVWDSILVVKGKKSKRLRQVIDLGTNEGLYNISPCWMTNPNTACQIFPLTEEYFDTVIFDEASQCPIEQAIPLIYRAKKIIVSGDEKQLPPTSFFKSGFETEEEEEEEKPEDEMSSSEITQRNIERAKQEQIASSESLLEASKVILKDVYLNTHYRSLHPSLIAFSNHAFYNKRLEVPDLNSHNEYLKEPPIVYKNIEGIYKEEKNRDEARHVIGLVKQVWSENPRPTVGIVTFNRKQRDLVYEELIKECEDNRIFESTYESEVDRKDGNQGVGFFIKNIETVQGDERDVMIFSTTFGKNEEGAFKRNFGPINIEGGEKRLNVVITRSKKRMYIVTSMPIFQISDIIAKNGTSPGANIRGREYLHLFMHYARATSQGNQEDQKRYLDLASSLIRSSSVSNSESNVVDSEFEQEVASELEKIGFTVSLQIGESGFKIDLAIKHRNEKQGYILGIECDGASYHSSYSARMRDIWRQDILESRGWIIHRVWSTDWWDDPQREIERIKRRIDAIYEENGSDKQSFKNKEQANGETYTKAEYPEKECSGKTSDVHQEGQLPTNENTISTYSKTMDINFENVLSPEISLQQENSYSRVCLPMTMKLAAQSREYLESPLKKLPNSWPFMDKVVVLLYPFFEGDIKKFHSDDGPNMKELFQDNQLESIDRELKTKLEDYLEELKKETNESSQGYTYSSEPETNTENQIFNEATGNVQGRLDDALEYIEYKRKKRSTKENKVDQIMRKAIIDLLKLNTQGKDLIANNVLRELGISCRGTERTKLKNKVLRIVKDMKDKSIIEEYKTDTRKRLKLIKLDFE